MSYQNIILYSRAMPMYDDEKKKKWDKNLDADNPDNFKDERDEVFVK